MKPIKTFYYYKLPHGYLFLYDKKHGTQIISNFKNCKRYLRESHKEYLCAFVKKKPRKHLGQWNHPCILIPSKWYNKKVM